MLRTNHIKKRPYLVYIRNSRPQDAVSEFSHRVNTDEKLAHLERTRIYFLQSAARDLLRSERVSFCTRLILPHEHSVNVMKHAETSSVHYRNLAVCASVWHCPLCSGRISEHRREELTRAFKASGYNVALLTYTLHHRKTTKLKTVLGMVQDAYRRTKSGRAYQAAKKELGIVGSIKALEVTYGRHGWHPHIHELLVLDATEQADIDKIDATLRTLWLDRVKKIGGYAHQIHGFKVSDHQHAIKEYVAKYGKLPARLTDDEGEQNWSLEHELTKGLSKRSRDDENGFTPFQLLEAYAIHDDEEAKRLFQEYAFEFKGRLQLQWSRGLKDLLNVEEISDEMAAEKHQHDEQYELLAEIDLLTWRKILSERKRAYILNLATQVSPDAFRALIQCEHPDYPANIRPDLKPYKDHDHV